MSNTSTWRRETEKMLEVQFGVVHLYEKKYVAYVYFCGNTLTTLNT